MRYRFPLEKRLYVGRCRSGTCSVSDMDDLKRHCTRKPGRSRNSVKPDRVELLTAGGGSESFRCAWANRNGIESPNWRYLSADRDRVTKPKPPVFNLDEIERLVRGLSARRGTISKLRVEPEKKIGDKFG